MSAASADVFENQTRAISWDILTPTMPFALMHVIQSPAGFPAYRSSSVLMLATRKEHFTLNNGC